MVLIVVADTVLADNHVLYTMFQENSHECVLQQTLLACRIYYLQHLKVLK